MCAGRSSQMKDCGPKMTSHSAQERKRRLRRVSWSTEVQPISFMGKITLTDENGGVSHVTIADVKQSNGVIHVVDKVLLPKM